MLLAGFDLAALVVLGAGALLTRSQLAALALSVCSAAWLPLNNGHLEGPVLAEIDAGHGLTAMDLFAYAGLATAVVVLARGELESMRRQAIVGSVAVFVLGLAVSYFFQPG